MGKFFSPALFLAALAYKNLFYLQLRYVPVLPAKHFRQQRFDRNRVRRYWLGTISETRTSWVALFGVGLFVRGMNAPARGASRRGIVPIPNRSRAARTSDQRGNISSPIRNRHDSPARSVSSRGIHAPDKQSHAKQSHAKTATHKPPRTNHTTPSRHGRKRQRRRASRRAECLSPSGRRVCPTFAPSYIHPSPGGTPDNTDVHVRATIRVRATTRVTIPASLDDNSRAAASDNKT